MPVVNWQQTLRHHGWTNSWTRCSVLRTSIAASPCSDFRKRTDDHHRSAVASLGDVAGPGPARTSGRVARHLDQPGPGTAHHRRLCARAGGVPCLLYTSDAADEEDS